MDGLSNRCKKARSRAVGRRCFMRLSSLVVALLLVSPVLFAQHSSSSSGSSSSSSSSHSSSSSGSSSASHTSSTHSSGGSTPSSNHSSGGSVSRSSSTGSAASRSNTRPIREPNKTVKQDHGTAEPREKSPRERKGVFAFLHHRHRKPAPTVVPPLVEAEHRRRGCPPGQSAGKNGVCVANPTNASLQCPPNEPGGRCNIADQCTSFRGQLDAAAAELRSINAEMRNVDCSGTAPGQECGFLSQRREASIAHYRAIQSGIPVNCRAALPDPLSL